MTSELYLKVSEVTSQLVGVFGTAILPVVLEIVGQTIIKEHRPLWLSKESQNNIFNYIGSFFTQMVKHNCHPHVVYLKQLAQGKVHVAFAVLHFQVLAREARGVGLCSGVVSLWCV